jgi:hypothetical protein
MTLSAQAQARVRVQASQTQDVDFCGDGIQVIDENLGITLTAGTAANQCNLIWTDQRTLTQGTNETLDLKNASLVNAIGNTVAMDVLKFIYVKNNSTALTLSINGVASGVAFTSANTETIQLPPGAFVCFGCATAAAWDTASNTKLKFAASAGAGSLTFDVMIIGVDS